MRALFCTAALSFALLVASSATGSAPSPSVVTKWTVFIPSSAEVALVAQDIVLFSYQTQKAGEYNNTVQAATSNHSSLWAMSSVGLVQSYTTAYAFPTIPKLIFLLVNNIQPPNVSAVVPSTGAVVWSTPGAFDATQGGSLVSSVDGSTLYLFTPSPGGTTQLTAFDSGSGEVLFAESEPLPYFQPLQCGSFGIGCFANWTGNAATFFDGRSGALLGSVSLPTFANGITFISQSLVLLTSGGFALYVINTTNYTLAWSMDVPSGTSPQLLTMPAGSTTNVAIILGNTGNLPSFRALDAATGEVMWDVTAKAVCPFASPAPGYAASFSQYQLGQLQPGGDLFVFAAVCWYSGGQTLNILGWMNATDGAVTKWRYLQYFPASPATPVGSSYFMQLYYSAGSEASQYFYESSSLTLATEYPPCCWCQSSSQVRATVQGADVIFILTCWETQSVVAVTIAN